MKSPQRQSASQEQAEILEIAQRETSPEHFAEFEPITRGPLFAAFALVPLGAMAAVFLIWQKLRGQRS